MLLNIEPEKGHSNLKRHDVKPKDEVLTAFRYSQELTLIYPWLKISLIKRLIKKFCMQIFF